jgi:uncharacterized integral membrane protein
LLRGATSRSTLTVVSTPDPRPAHDPLSTDVPGRTAPPTGSGPATPAPAPATPAPAPQRRTGRTIGRTLAAALLVFVTVVLVLFVMFNTQTVDVSLVFTDVEAPLVLALVVAAALGGLLVWLAGAVLRARRRNR